MNIGREKLEWDKGLHRRTCAAIGQPNFAHYVATHGDAHSSGLDTTYPLGGGPLGDGGFGRGGGVLGGVMGGVWEALMPLGGGGIQTYQGNLWQNEHWDQQKCGPETSFTPHHPLPHARAKL